MEFARLHTGQVQGRPARLRRIDGSPVDLYLADTDEAIARDEPQRSAPAQGAVRATSRSRRRLGP